METKGRIAVIGFMGSGKTTVSRLVARRLRLKLVELDEVIEKITGMKIAEIFENQGEDFFRKIESQALKETLQYKKVIVSCGGGIVEKEKNREILKEHFFVIYLKSEWKDLWERIKNDRKRPKANDSEQAVKELFLKRLAFYEETADAVVETQGKSPEEIAELIVERWKEWQKSRTEQ